MYEVKVRMETPGIVERYDESGAPVYEVEPATFEPGDRISKADLGRVQSPEDVKALLKQKVIEEV